MPAAASPIDGLLERVRKNPQGEFVLERGDVLPAKKKALALTDGEALFSATGDSVRLFDALVSLGAAKPTLSLLQTDLLEPLMERLEQLATHDISSGRLKRLATNVKKRGSWASEPASKTAGWTKTGRK